MTDLHARFRTLDDLQAPNLWPEVEARASAVQDRGVRRLSWLLIAATLLVLLALGGAALVGSGLVKLPVLPVLPDSSPTPSSSPQGPIPLLVGCNAAVSWCEDIPANTYETTVGYGPLPGLVVTLPAGWSSTDPLFTGAFNLHRVGDTNANDVLYFWRDIVAVDQTGQPAAAIGTTPQDLADFLATDPRLIVSDRDTATIGNGIPTITLVVQVNPAGPNDDPEGCPGESCANVLRAPGWDGAFGITVNAFEDPNLACPCSHAVRLYLVSIGPASDPGTFVVAVQVFAPDPDSELVMFQEDVQSIIDSIRLPAGTEVLQP